MIYRLLADAVVVIHVIFVIFVVLGGFLLRRWPKLVFAHAPAAMWGALIEFAGWICPLTPLENALRARGGQTGYEGGFIDHYLIPLLYPAALSRGMQFALGGFVLAVNAVAYVIAWRGRKGK